MLRNKATRNSTSISAASDKFQIGFTPELATSASSFKCWDERCLHYIYGLASQGERDNHLRTHVAAPVKRDSGLSLEQATPRLPTKSNDQRSTSVPPSPQHAAASQSHTHHANLSSLPPLILPVSQAQSSHNPQQIKAPSILRETPRGSAALYPNPPSRAGTRRSSDESETDPQLPPLKRSRVGHSRLQSIGELQLLRDDQPCLRCRLSHRPVGSTSFPLAVSFHQS